MKITEAAGGRAFAAPVPRSVLLCILLLVLAAAGCAAVPAAGLAPAPYRNPVRIGEIASTAVDEASGMAASLRRPGCFWLLNDSGNEPLIFAAGPAGEDLGAIQVAGAVNHDWEDMASFSRPGRPCLLLADVGDNRALRPSCSLYLLAEPDMPGKPGIAPTPVRAERIIRFRYPEGPRDCEAVAVDKGGTRVLLLTKRLKPPVLYSIRLDRPRVDGIVVAERLGTVASLPVPSEAEMLAAPLFGRFRSQPTAMDISADGRRAAVLTYARAYLYTRQRGEGWLAAFLRPPQSLPEFTLRQAEALCFGSDGRTLFVTTEQRPAPLLHLAPMDDMRP